jgi:hypothetical protein
MIIIEIASFGVRNSSTVAILSQAVERGRAAYIDLRPVSSDHSGGTLAERLLLSSTSLHHKHQSNTLSASAQSIPHNGRLD